MPAPAVIPAPIAYIKVAAVKKLVARLKRDGWLGADLRIEGQTSVRLGWSHFCHPLLRRLVVSVLRCSFGVGVTRSISYLE